jgi:crossover junction endodeoxyribonuclease RuvC
MTSPLLMIAESSHTECRVLSPVPCILGVDPGASGAISFLFPSNASVISVEDVPTVAGEIDAATLADHIRQMAPDIAVIERVGAMPKQGVSSTFKFGMAYGVAQGVIATLKIPVYFVTPAKWKKHFALPADKEEARKRALQRWPARADLFARKKDHGRAEAALLALYGAEVILAGGAK